MDKNVIKFTNTNKDECVLCGRKTLLSLSVSVKQKGLDKISLPLCDKCAVSILEGLHDKREDLISDMMVYKEGMSLDDARESFGRVSELESEVEDLQSQINNTNEDDDE